MYVFILNAKPRAGLSFGQCRAETVFVVQTIRRGCQPIETKPTIRSLSKINTFYYTVLLLNIFQCQRAKFNWGGGTAFHHKGDFRRI